jgi:hypothetical protein
MEISTHKCISCDNEPWYHVKNQFALDQFFCDLHLSPVFDKTKLPAHVVLYGPEYITSSLVEEEKTKISKKKKAVAEPVEEPAEELVEESTE